MLSYGLAQSQKEIEADILIIDDEINSQYALSSIGMLGGGISSKKNIKDT